MMYDDSIPRHRDGLVDYQTAEELRALCKLIPAKTPTRKADMVDLIIGHLKGRGLRAVFESMTELDRLAVAEVVHSRYSTHRDDMFHAKYGGSPDFSRGTYRESDVSPLRLVFMGSNLVMPLDLQDRFKAFVPEPRPETVHSLPELPENYERSYEKYNHEAKKYEVHFESIPLSEHYTEHVAQRELKSVLRLIDSKRIAVSAKTRKPSGASIQLISGILEPDDYYQDEKPVREYSDENAGPIRAFAWPMILQAGGFVELSGARLQLTTNGRKALSEPSDGNLRKLWNKWLKTSVLDELSRIDAVKGQTGRGKRSLIATSKRRSEIVAALSDCPVNRWLSVDELFRFSVATGRYFSVARDYRDFYISNPELRIVRL